MKPTSILKYLERRERGEPWFSTTERSRVKTKEIIKLQLRFIELSSVGGNIGKACLLGFERDGRFIVSVTRDEEGQQSSQMEVNQDFQEEINYLYFLELWEMDCCKSYSGIEKDGMKKMASRKLFASAQFNQESPRVFITISQQRDHGLFITQATVLPRQTQTDAIQCHFTLMIYPGLIFYFIFFITLINLVLFYFIDYSFNYLFNLFF